MSRMTLLPIHRFLPFLVFAVAMACWYAPESAHGQILFVSSASDVGSVGEYTVSGGVVTSSNSSLITGLSSPDGLVVSGGDVYVSNFGGTTVGQYSASTGSGNASFVSADTSEPYGVAVSGGD